MASVPMVTALLLLVALLASAAELSRVSAPVVLVLAGLAIGFVPGVPHLRIEPDVVFLLFLPPLLYTAAFKLAAEDVRDNARSIGLLAVGLVVATIVAVAAVGHLVVGLPWSVAFVLGAVVGPTDPVSAAATFRRLGAPPRIVTILEGESLVNDGTALVALRIAVGAVGASFSAGHAVLQLGWTVVAGLVIGAAVGWLATRVRGRIDQPQVEITLALVTAYGAFLAADQVGASGILASVAGGLLVGRRATELGSPEARLQAYGFFDVVVFLVESALFLLIGLGFRSVVTTLGDAHSVPELAGDAAVVTAVVLGVRAVWMFTVPHVSALLDPRTSGAQARTPWRERAALAVAGMRGAVTVAAALSIPMTTHGAPFPDRGLVLFLAYATVVVTLVGPTLALPAVLRALGLAKGRQLRRQALEARLDVTHAALARVEQLAREDDLPEEALQRARETYEMRIARAETEAREEEPDEREVEQAYRTIRRDLLEAERSRLAELREERNLPGDTLRDIERTLDLEEARLDS